MIDVCQQPRTLGKRVQTAKFRCAEHDSMQEDPLRDSDWHGRHRLRREFSGWKYPHTCADFEDTSKTVRWHGMAPRRTVRIVTNSRTVVQEIINIVKDGVKVGEIGRIEQLDSVVMDGAAVGQVGEEHVTAS